MDSSQEILEKQRSIWNDLALAWEQWIQRTAAAWQPMMDALESELPVEVASVLDVATGTGEPGLTIADKRRSAVVVGTDIAEAMLEVASMRARERGLANFRTQVCEAGSLPFDSSSFDAVVCRLGIMLFPDPMASLREICRVMKPGARATFTVWGPRANNAWLALAGAAVRQTLGLPETPANAPGIFRLSHEDALSGLLSAAGLEDVTARELHGAIRFESPEDYVQIMLDMVPPTAAVMRHADARTRERAKQAILSLVETHTASDGSLPMTWSIWICAGTKAPGA